MNLQMTVMFGVFFFLLGACVGSFLNVVIWRLPHRGREVIYLDKRGRMTLSWPPSHCPVCDAPIQWYQNIPMVSWLVLRGRCANCRTPIPIRYPLVELATGVMFLGMYLVYFVGGWMPGVADVRTDWPPYVLHVVFAAALLAASAIDADLYIIPLQIPWFLAVVGVVGAGLIGPPLCPSFPIIPDIGGGGGAAGGGNWWLAKPVIGGAVGLVLANVLMWLKLMPRSFDGPPHAVHAEADAGPPAGGGGKRGFAVSGPANDPPKKDRHGETHDGPLAPPPKLTKFGPAVIAAAAVLGVVGVLWAVASPKAAAAATVGAAIVVFLLGVLPRDAGQVDVTADVLEEINAPNVRGEMMKELLFLALPAVCAALMYVAPVQVPHAPWLGRVLGSVFGLLVGGGVVWLIRVAGSLAFGKEAMGMGDAHLMAGVGAVIGAQLVVLAFFAAPFVAILWAIVLKLLGKPNVLPYGPWLSIASILVLFLGNPVIDLYIGLMFVPPPVGGIMGL
jgi:prepilin signal peptidase PulO-like enzyme (type II secretory pathway)